MKRKTITERLLSIAAAILLWQLLSMWLGQKLLLPSPLHVAGRLWSLLGRADTWKTVGYSFLRIEAGFFLGMITGGILAALSARFHGVEVFLWPYLKAMKTVAVASFIILALIWVKASGLSILIAFLMVLPVFYFNLLEGIRSTDRKLLEMTEVFQMSTGRRIYYLYLPQLCPFFLSAASLALGISWKAGVAAEVIGIPDGSMGERLYEAKIYLETADLFAWTILIVAVCACFELVFMKMAGKLPGGQKNSRKRSKK